nr:glutamate receptor U1-like [Cherax quadricarinatus]
MMTLAFILAGFVWWGDLHIPEAIAEHHIASSVTQMAKPGLTTHVVEPGLTTHVVEPGLTTHVVEPGLTTQVVEPRLTSCVMEAKLTTQVVEDILTQAPHGSYSVIFITDGTMASSTLFMIIDHLRFPGGVGVFEIVTNSEDINMDKQLSLLVNNVKRLRQLSSHTTVTVISDNTDFICAFVQSSFRLRLLVWSTRLLVVTRSHLMDMQELYTAFSKLNSVLAIFRKDTANIRCNMYIVLPYSEQRSQVVQVASWTTLTGLFLTSDIPLFPEKFTKLSHGPNLLVASEANPFNKIISVNDPKNCSEHRVQFAGPVQQLIDYLSIALNFTYTYVQPPDGIWGVRLKNGTWTGMLGMVMREEVGIGAGPFSIDENRALVVDYTAPILIDYMRILGARGLPEVNPWGFLFPLTLLVWVAILATLIILAFAKFLMSSCISLKSDSKRNWFKITFDYARILLQQDYTVVEYWRWEKVVLVVWMMVTLVLTRSYSGNLMALLAVKHIPQPYQTLRDVVDDPSVTMIWEKDSGASPILKSAESGIFREIADKEKVGKLIWKTQPQFPEAIDTLVRRGDHVLMRSDSGHKTSIAQDFTKTGQCSFYESREEFMQIMLAMIGPKDSPIVPAINKRIMSMTEAGLFFQWLEEDRVNATACYHASSKITVNAALSISNIWGMFVILSLGHLASLSIFCIELLINLSCTSFR